MSEAAIVIAALFAMGMMGLSVALFVKATRERSEVDNPLPSWARPRGLS